MFVKMRLKLFIFSVTSSRIDGCTSLFAPFFSTIRIVSRGVPKPISTSGHTGISVTNGCSFELLNLEPSLHYNDRHQILNIYLQQLSV